MSAATILAQAFGEGACLYKTVLTVPRDATPSQLRKAYYKKALQYHPDKLDTSILSEEQMEQAKAKFQAISLAYTILSDEEKRAEYDESGDLYDDDDDLSANKSGVKQWTDYFKNIFPTVTTADIDAFEVKYKCSDEEEADVLKYYEKCRGDLNAMLAHVMLSSEADKERWVTDYIKPAIARGHVKDYSETMNKTVGDGSGKTRSVKKRCGGKKMAVEEVEMSESEEDEDAPTAEVVDEDDSQMNVNVDANNSKPRSKSNATKSSPKKKSSSKKASAPKSKPKSSKKSSSEDDLIAQIRGNALARRQEGFDSLMAGLEDRYGGGGTKKKGKKSTSDDISDDEFERIQQKLMKNKRSR